MLHLQLIHNHASLSQIFLHMFEITPLSRRTFTSFALVITGLIVILTLQVCDTFSVQIYFDNLATSDNYLHSTDILITSQ